MTSESDMVKRVQLLSEVEKKFIAERLNFNRSVISEFEIFLTFFGPEKPETAPEPTRIFAEAVKSFLDMYQDLKKSSDSKRALLVSVESVRRDLIVLFSEPKIVTGNSACQNEEQMNGNDHKHD